MGRLNLRTLPSIHPNAGTQALYRRRLLKLIDEMNDSVWYWLSATYKANEPEISQDALPAIELRRAIRKLSLRWQRRFRELAPKLAAYYAQSANKRISSVLTAALKEAGITVKFKMTTPMRDVMQASVSEQVLLIRSIPTQYFTQLEGAVMRSVSRGRDLGQLSKELQKNYGVTRKRAALISRDQNNKMTAVLNNARQKELGITKAIWRHSAAGKNPRATHVANNGKPYGVTKGWYDPHEKKWVLPGELINCRCTSQSVIPGFE